MHTNKAAVKLYLSQQFALSAAATEKLAHTLPSSTVRGWVSSALLAGAAQAKLLKKIDAAQLTLRWVADKEGRSLNHTHRGQGVDHVKDYATNVLTFAYGIQSKVLAADIVLCWPVLVSEAKAQRKTLRAHAAHLIAHGVLHALGFDHEVEADALAMEALEVALLAKLRIANPYIEAN
jgi:probable rRNA maturation factor